MNADLLRFSELLCQDEHYWHGIYVGGEEPHNVNFPSLHLNGSQKKLHLVIKDISGISGFISALVQGRGCETPS